MEIIEKQTGDIFRRNAVGDISIRVYQGCDQECPFCYWQADPAWAGKIVVYTDAPERLAEAIGTLPKQTVLKLGYGAVDDKYGLTRKCLEILIQHEMRISLAANATILRDLDLLVPYRKHIKVIMEMTRFDSMKAFNETGHNPAFDVANEVKRSGLDICTTVSPILPGITDVERIAAAMPGIPVHISTLDIRPGTAWGKNTLDYIRVHYPELLPAYEEIMRTGVDPYYESLKAKYADGTGQIKAYLPFYDTIPDA